MGEHGCRTTQVYKSEHASWKLPQAETGMRKNIGLVHVGFL
jgi:hypothetical protein